MSFFTSFRMTDCLFTVMLSVSEPPSAGRPLSGTLRVPPLPLQRESILPEGWYFSEFIRKTKKPECKIFLRSGFNHIVNLFVNYINLLTKFWVYERRKMKNAKRNVIVSSFMAIALCMSIVAGATFELKSVD